MHARVIRDVTRRTAVMTVLALAAAACAASTAKEHAPAVVRSAPVAAAAAPGTEQFQALVNDAHARFAGVRDGKNASYIPILTTVPSELFGVAIATRDGRV